MFDLRDFVKNGFLKAVGKMEDYRIILNAAGWHEKGVLLESDLEDIQTLIEVHHEDSKEKDETAHEVASV